ncbi:MAG TPA: hypothetical protein VMB74_09720 [Streptosporangiaceae bacterium]|nr:hypothetical protein [Streptosporangiaceae bacterium]
MVLNRKRVVASMAASGIAVGVLAGGGAAAASASPARGPVAAVSASGWPGGCGAMGKMWPGHDPVAKAAAGYLGLSQDQLRHELEHGKSLADVARSQGKSVSGLKATILSAITSWVDASKLSAAQKAKVISEARDHADAIVNTSCKSAMGSHDMG